jgi:plasmid stability protein
MKNITLTIDDEIHSRARVLAARRGTSISALVREFLERETCQADSEGERIAELEALFARADERAKASGKKRIAPLTPLTRDEIYEERIR